jgi:hypothetical protein
MYHWLEFGIFYVMERLYFEKVYGKYVNLMNFEDLGRKIELQRSDNFVNITRQIGLHRLKRAEKDNRSKYQP